MLEKIEFRARQNWVWEPNKTGLSG